MGAGAMMEAFAYHGGGVTAAAQRFGGRIQDWLDLSTGINPTPWPGQIAPDWRGLPEAGALTDLETAAAAHFGVASELCCAVPGSEMALRLIGQWLGRGTYLWPSYRTHAAAFAEGVAAIWQQGAAPHQAAPQEAGALLLANPNNPDGRVVPAAQLRAWHDDLAARDGWLVVDEAFADASPDVSVAGQVGAWRRLIVLRSFGKFFGLAGLRLGFVLGPPPVIAMLRALLGDWPIGVAALAMGRAAYRDAGWIVQARDDLSARAARMDDVLAHHRLRARGRCPHFRLIEDDAARALFACLARLRILTRPFDYDPRWLRIGIPAREADWQRLERALDDAL